VCKARDNQERDPADGTPVRSPAPGQPGRAAAPFRWGEGTLLAMLGAITDHMSMMDADLNILWANETAKALFGQDIVGRKCYEAYHGRKRPCEPDPCLTLKAFQDGKIHEHYTAVVDKDGNVHHFHCTANVALWDEEGNPSAVIEISRDVTKRTRAEEALRDSEERLRVILDTVADGVLIADAETKEFIDANPAGCRMLGRTRDEITKLNIMAIHPEKDLPHVIETFNRQAGGGESLAHDLPVQRKDGSVFLADFNSAPASLGGKKCLVGTMHDATERKRLQEAEAEALRLRAIRDLAAGMAHNYNNLLTGIMGYASFLREELAARGAPLDDLEKLLECTQAACQLTDGLRASTASVELTARPVEIDLLAAELASECGAACPANTEVLVNGAAPGRVVMGRKGDLYAALLHICDNAREAMPDGGTLTITTTAGQRREPGSDTEYVVIAIADTGVGMTPEVAEKVFEPFFSTKNTVGVGLSLSVARHVIEQHGGDVEVETSPGKGSTFRVWLPVA